MKAYKKNYLGNGQQVVTNAGATLEIVKMVLSVEEMMKFVHEYEGKEYVSFEVAKMRKANDYGDTHTVYHTTFEEVEAETTTPAPQKKKRGRPTKAETAKKIAAAEKAKARQDLLDPLANKETLAEKEEFKQQPQTENTPF